MADADPQQMMLRYEQLQRSIQAMDRQISFIESTLADLRRGLATLEGLGDQPTSVLMPVGGGVHVPATVDPTQPVVFPIGADLAAEGTLADARARLEARVAEATESMEQASARASELAKEMEATMAALQAQQ